MGAFLAVSQITTLNGITLKLQGGSGIQQINKLHSSANEQVAKKVFHEDNPAFQLIS